MSKYAGADDVKVYGKKARFVNTVLGTHMLEVTAIRHGENQDDVPWYAVDFVCHASESIDPNAKPFKEGEEVVELQTKGSHAGAKEHFLRDIKNVLGAILNKDDYSDVTSQEINAEAENEKQPRVGTILEAETYQHSYTPKKGKNAGKRVTVNKVRYEYLGANMKEAAARLAEEAGEE